MIRSVRALLAVTWLVCFSLSSLPTRAAENDKELGFVDSVASMVYAAAWPSATYKSWGYKSFERVSDGSDLVVRLKGESAFDNSELWIDIVFRFRNGSFSDMGVVGHNAFLVPPFETMKTLAAATLEIANQYANENSAPAPAPQANAEPAAAPVHQPPATHQVRVVTACSQAISLWLASVDSQGEWRTQGPWAISAATRTVLANSENVPLNLSDSSVYFYAEIPGSPYVWKGEQKIAYGDRTLTMQAQQLALTGDGFYEFSMACDNYEAPHSQMPSRLLGVRIADVKGVQIQGRVFDGVQVTGLMNGFPAAVSGLQIDDLITDIEGQSVGTAAQIQKIVSATDGRALHVTAQRAGGPMVFSIQTAPAPIRQPVDESQCRLAGDPPDYFLGAVAIPFRGPGGELVIPRYPQTAGRLFDPDEVDFYFKPEHGLYVYFSKPLREDIASFEYHDMDHVVLAVLESGERADLGVRVHCLMQPAFTQSTRIHLSRVKDGKAITDRELPLVAN